MIVNSPPDTYLAVLEAAAVMRVNKQTVYRLIYGGKLPWINIGQGKSRARIRIRRSALDQFMGLVREERRSMSDVVEPLDPDSEHGKAIAAKWSRTLAIIERELWEAECRIRPVGDLLVGPPQPASTAAAEPKRGARTGVGLVSDDYPRTIKEAAAEIGIGYHKLRKLVAGNAVPCKKFGRSVRFFDADIAAIKEQFQVTPRPVSVVPIARGRRAA